MPIKEITKYETSDGRTFSNRDHAEVHEKTLLENKVRHKTKLLKLINEGNGVIEIRSRKALFWSDNYYEAIVKDVNNISEVVKAVEKWLNES